MKRILEHYWLGVDVAVLVDDTTGDGVGVFAPGVDGDWVRVGVLDPTEARVAVAVAAIGARVRTGVWVAGCTMTGPIVGVDDAKGASSTVGLRVAVKDGMIGVLSGTAVADGPAVRVGTRPASGVDVASEIGVLAGRSLEPATSDAKPKQ